MKDPTRKQLRQRKLVWDLTRALSVYAFFTRDVIEERLLNKREQKRLYDLLNKTIRNLRFKLLTIPKNYNDPQTNAASAATTPH